MKVLYTVTFVGEFERDSVLADEDMQEHIKREFYERGLCIEDAKNIQWEVMEDASSEKLQ